MKRTCTLLTLSVFLSSLAFGQMEANMLGNWQDDDIIMTSWLNSRYNEVWGIAINGGEYGIIGSTEGVHIIDVTDPANVQEIHRVDGSAFGTNLVHRDYKTYAGYLYCVADEGSSTLQIIDLNDLPNSVTEVYSDNEFVITAHNIFIDEEHARLYIIGDGGGLRVLDISTPDQPTLLADNVGTPIPYAHDAYIRDHIAYLNCANSGLWVVDYTDPANPTVLGVMDDYPESGYNHSGWLSDDGQWYFLLDETHSTSIKTVDVSDPTNMSVVALFSPDVWNNEIPHNAIIQGDYLYVSYYYDGLQVWDISDPLMPERVAYYDTFNGPNEAFYAGMWGVYPLLPSGNILCSDMQTGFYLFEALPEILDFSLTPNQTEFSGCVGDVFTFDLVVSEDFAGPVDFLVNTQPVATEIDFSANPAMPGETVTVTLTFTESTAGVQELIFSGSDDVNSASVFLNVEAGVAPDEATLAEPFGSLDLADEPVVNFDWDNASSASSYRLEIAEGSDDFTNNLVFSATTTDTNYEVDILEVWKSYFWRVISQNNCGEAISAVADFETTGGTAVGELNGATLNVYPSPAADILVVQFDQALGADLLVELTSLTGQALRQRDFAAGENSLVLDVSEFAAGMYLLRITDGTSTHVQRIIVN